MYGKTNTMKKKKEQYEKKKSVLETINPMHIQGLSIIIVLISTRRVVDLLM